MARKSRSIVSVEPLEDRLVPAWFLKFDTVPGEAPPSDPSTCIEIESWSFGTAVVPPATSSTTPSAGDATIQEIVITRKTDAASPMLYQKCVTGEHIPEARLDFFKSDQPKQPYLDFVLQDVIVSGYSMSGGGDRPTETVSLNFTKLSLNPQTTTTQQGPASNTQATGQFPANNTFPSVPFNVPFRPHRLRGRRGQPVFVGPSGEEIDADKYGRVKVQFHWDRRGNPNDISDWVRAIQRWAGKHWGALFIPRVGQEVVVAFEEGDPDKPVVIGRIRHGGR